MKFYAADTKSKPPFPAFSGTTGPWNIRECIKTWNMAAWISWSSCGVNGSAGGFDNILAAAFCAD